LHYQALPTPVIKKGFKNIKKKRKKEKKGMKLTIMCSVYQYFCEHTRVFFFPLLCGMGFCFFVCDDFVVVCVRECACVCVCTCWLRKQPKHTHTHTHSQLALFPTI
jgi:hypothetical protein